MEEQKIIPLSTFPAQPKSIYVVGAQSTGKTTLVDGLTAYFDHAAENAKAELNRPIVIKEVARTVLQKHNFTALDITTSPARALLLQKLILNAQNQAEDETSGKWFISDRSGLDPIVYAKVYVGEDAFEDMLHMPTSMKLLQNMRDSLVCICEMNALWLNDDGVRLMPKNSEDWESFHQTFLEVLREQGIKYTVLNKDTNVVQRVGSVLAEWRKL
jgi:nicotinamide riboside kinase